MWIFSLVLILFFIGNVSGNVSARSVAEVFYYKGHVDILRKGSIRGLPIQTTNNQLFIGDILRTKSNGYAKVNFIDKNKVEVYPDSRLIVLSYEQNKEINLRKGVVKFEISRLSGVKAFTIRTNTAIIGVKGTIFWVYVFPFQTIVIVEKGIVELTPISLIKQKGGKKIIKSGQLSIVSYNKPPKVEKLKNYQINFLKERQDLIHRSFKEVYMTSSLFEENFITSNRQVTQSTLTPELTEDPYSFTPPPTGKTMNNPSICITFKLP